MNLPKIDFSAIPGLETATGIYGSVTQSAVTYDDSVFAVMVILYESSATVGSGLI